MGIMGCNRKNCENIMSDDYSEVTGYICYDCKRELEESKPECVDDVLLFMKSPKQEKYLGEDNKFSLEKMFGKCNDTW